MDLSDLGDAPFAGYANRCAFVVDADAFAELGFWETLAGEAPRPVARFRIAVHDLYTDIWKGWEKFMNDSLREMNFTRAQLPPIDASIAVRPDGPAPLVNAMPIARSAQHALIDCHYVSPRAHLRGVSPTRHSERITITPVFSIAMPSILLLSLLESISTQKATLQALSDRWGKSN